MTAPRTALFQRKGAPTPAKKPAIAITISHGGTPGSDDGAGPGVTAEGDGSPDVTCPKCGYSFNPDETGGETVGKPADGDALANLFGGSAQAPAGA